MLIKTNRNKLHRRTMLKGLGTCVALPFLEAMLPAKASAASNNLKFIGYYVPCGINMAAWKPENYGTGDQWSLSQTLAPLANVKSKLNVLGNINNNAAIYPGGDHAAGTAAFMSCMNIKNSQTDIQNGISADQHIANQIGTNTAFKSLQLGIDNPSICDSTFSCAYSRNISWASATQPLTKITDPQVIWNQLFSGFDQDQTSNEQIDRIQNQKSVLDYVLAQTQSLNAQLGNADKAKLDEYLTGLRELEQRLDLQRSISGCTVMSEPANNLGLDDTIDVMTDIMVQALQCDQTRVISFMLADGLSDRNHSFIGASGGHHHTSHHKNQSDNLEKLATIDRWEVSKLALLLERLDAKTDGDGTMLDNTFVYFSSELSDGDQHSHADMPIVLAGGGSRLETNRYINFNNQTLANMFISVMQQYGVNLSRFGRDGNGTITGLF